MKDIIAALLDWITGMFYPDWRHVDPRLERMLFVAALAAATLIFVYLGNLAQAMTFGV